MTDYIQEDFYEGQMLSLLLVTFWANVSIEIHLAATQNYFNRFLRQRDVTITCHQGCIVRIQQELIYKCGPVGMLSPQNLPVTSPLDTCVFIYWNQGVLQTNT